MIEVSEATKAYGELVALAGLSLAVGQGECVALLGPNGAGKSTLLKAIGGLVRLDSGTIRIQGVTARERVGRVPQRIAFPPRRTPWELLAGFARLRGLAERSVGEALAAAGLDAVADRRIGGLSGGTRQRLAIAQALLGDPPVLLLDEPLTGLDPAAVRDFLAFVDGLRRSGKTILISTHHLEEASSVADRAVILHSGKIIETAACGPGLAEVYLAAIARAQRAA